MRNCSSLGFQRQNILSYNKPPHAVLSHITMNRSAQRDLLSVHCNILARGKNYLLEHEKGTSDGVILVDKTCFLMCDRCAILPQNESFHLFTASLNPLAPAHIVRVMLVLQIIVTNGD